MSLVQDAGVWPSIPLVSERDAPLPAVSSRPEPVPNATIVARHDFTDSMAHFDIRLDSPLASAQPGQYVSLGIFDGGPLVQRTYSIVAYDQMLQRLELFIRRVRDGALSSRLWPLGAGARVRIGPAKGLFVLDRVDPRPRLFIGTGTGLAPLLAMIENLGSRVDGGSNVLIHGVAYQDEAVYRHRIGAWVATGLKLDYLPAVSRPDDPRNEGWTGLTGRADAILARVLEEWADLRGGIAYMCGNLDMIESCSLVLADGGFAAADIRAERFHTPPRAA